MTRNISGKILNSAALALSISSTAPPASIRYPSGSEAMIGCSSGAIWAETVGAWMPGTTSARTVSTMSRLRRHRIGSSKPELTWASCDSGTAPPPGNGTFRSSSEEGALRSAAGARTTTSIRSLPSRYCVTVTPESSICSVFETSAVLRPSARIRSWSSFTCMVLACSFQSNCGSMVLGLATITSRTCAAMRRTSLGSGPMTRNCTGKPTGGPNTIWSTRSLACGTAPSATAFSIFLRSRSRAAGSCAMMTVMAKLGLGRAGFSARKKRGAPDPT